MGYSVNWVNKFLLQFIFSNILFGEHLNYLCQRYVTKNLPTSDAQFSGIVSITKEHINACRKYCGCPVGEATFYEFGAGWDLIVPLALYAFGVKHQILVDVRKLLRVGLVNDTIEKFQRMVLDLGVLWKPERYIDGEQGNFLTSLKEYYSIEYRVPCDARQTGLVAGSIDCITSTNTLEHIPHQDTRAILLECHRLLSDDGVMSFRIDYQDHYAYFDNSISVYNFLQYSNEAWALFSPALHYQNRLRHRDYLELFQKTGFEIVEERRTDGTAADLETIERLPVDKRFRAYCPEELAIRNAHVVLRKSRMSDRYFVED